jgi:hypothetical protein
MNVMYVLVSINIKLLSVSLRLHLKKERSRVKTPQVHTLLYGIKFLAMQ